MNGTKRCRFVFQGVGSRGDIAPLVGLGAEMVRRGYECHLLANAAYESDASQRGLRFFPITDQTEIFWGAERENPENYFFPCLRPVAEYFARHLGQPSRTVVVNADRSFASNLLSERHGIPTVRLYLTPVKIHSLADPPYPVGAYGAGCFGHTFRTYYLPRFQDRVERNARTLGTINTRRAAVGLPAVDASSYVEPYVRRRVALFPDWYAPPAEDWPHGTECVGFPFFPSGSRIPDDLEAFVARHGRPVVFTPGTCTPNETELFFRCAAETSDALGRPVVFLSPYMRSAPGAAKERMLCLDYVDLGLFLDRASALVHHGGIGTTAQALRAGIPQVVIPNRFDQPDNGHRVARLGVGTVVRRPDATGPAVAHALAGLLEDEACRTRLATLQEETRTARAVARACDILESAGEGARKGGAARAGAAWKRTAPRLVPARPAGATASRKVLLVVWPDPADWAAPEALARALAERGDHVVVASAGPFGPHVRALGLDFVDLTGCSDWGQRWSLFEPLPHRVALREAVQRFVVTFDAAVARHRPDAVLFDSRYSALGIVAEASRLRWAIYERDLPRELDPQVPPPHAMVVPDRSPQSADTIRAAWRNQLGFASWTRRCESSSRLAYDWSRPYFPTAIARELERRFGRIVSFNRFAPLAPVARVARMIFSPRAFDFPRTREIPRCSWVGPCIDERRAEPAFPWREVPEDSAVVCAAFGAESARHPRTAAWLQCLVDVFAQSKDSFLVLACPDPPSRRPVDAGRVLIVERAPQLALLRRAVLAITDASFPLLKECAAAGVPTVAIALSPDQLRHAALVSHLGFGRGLDGDEAPSPEKLMAAIADVRGSAAVRERSAQLKGSFQAEGGPDRALAFVDRLFGAPVDGARPLRRETRDRGEGRVA